MRRRDTRSKSLRQLKEAIAVYDELLARPARAENADALGLAAWALHHKAISLADLKRCDEALATYDELLSRFGDSTSPPLRERAARALLGKASLQLHRGHYDEAIVLYDAAIARFSDATEPDLHNVVVDALGGAGKALFAQERFEEAIEIFDRLVEQVRDAGPELRKMAALALNNKVAALNHLGRVDEAVGAHQELTSEFGDDAVAVFDDVIRCNVVATEPWQRENLAGALAAKAALLIELNRRADAIAVMSDLITRFQDDDLPVVVHVVAQAREGRDQLLTDESDDE